ncbi:phospholipase D family protein [Shewanella insulae]|uniref:phospholipase D family protein n=1 Tax=Shewanella insulae TaxID=2681496 RepID=UPI001EFC7CA6|nr:phospholipase D family protein [Shewanella insulae]MCG9754986.1 phospholipase D family protein [Shewanella insulae]
MVLGQVMNLSVVSKSMMRLTSTLMTHTSTLMTQASKLMTLPSKLMTLALTLCLVSACSSLPPPQQLTPSHKLAAPTDSGLYRYLEGDLKAHPNKTGILPLSSGIDAFVARLAIVDAASQSIDLQYYIYHDDETGRLLIWHLIDAADRGVRVRVLLDDLTTKTLDNGLVLLASHPNIEIRLFNPSYERTFRSFAMLTGFSRLNHRMHNKSLTVDNQITVVGGRNIGNEYFSKNDDVDFGDFDLLTIGDVVDEVSNQFDRYWNSEQVESVVNLVPPPTSEMYKEAAKIMARNKQNFLHDEYLNRLELSDLLTQIISKGLAWYWGDAQLLYDPPQKASRQGHQEWLLTDLSHFLAKARHEVLIVSPYFVPTDGGCQALIEAAKQGIKITVITNSLAATDVLAVHAGYKAYRERLLENGIALYEVKVDINNRPSAWKGSSRTSLHAKTFVLDRASVFVGSFNFDPRSAWINTEMGLIVDQREFAGEMVDEVQKSLQRSSYRLGLEDGELVWHDDLSGKVFYADPDASFWRRFMADFIGLLPIESQL